MSDYNINNMDFKQLRNEVQLLRDELAIMKRKYEDIIYNLDTDNFSQRIVKQGKDMYTKIEQTAEEINLQAEKIGENSKNIASLEITADEISSEVFYVDENGEKQSVITQTAEEIKSEVSDVTKDVSTLSSSITQTAGKIQMVVNASYSNPIEDEYFVSSRADKNKLYYESSSGSYWYYNGESWCESDNANFGSVFEQTAHGFKLKGNVELDGNLISNANIAGSTLSSRVGNEYGDGAVLNGVDGSIDMYYGSGKEPVSRWKWSDAGSFIGATTGANFGVEFDGWRLGTDENRNLKIVSRNRDNGSKPGMFIVNVKNSDSYYKEVKFVGLNTTYRGSSSPCIYANEKELATCEWVEDYVANNGSGGTVTAVFA